MNYQLTNIVDAIESKVTKRQERFDSRGIDKRATYFAQFGKLAQKSLGVQFYQVDATSRGLVKSELERRGFTVQQNTETNAKGRERFFSFTVTSA